MKKTLIVYAIIIVAMILADFAYRLNKNTSNVDVNLTDTTVIVRDSKKKNLQEELDAIEKVRGRNRFFFGKEHGNAIVDAMKEQAIKGRTPIY